MTKDIKNIFNAFFNANFKSEEGFVLEFDEDYDDKAFVKDIDGYLQILVINPITKEAELYR